MPAASPARVAAARAGFAAAALVTLSARGRAQAVETTAVDAALGRPLPNTIVALWDSAGRLHGTALTDDDGRAVLAAPHEGRFVVRAERTGRRGVTSPIVRVAGRDTVRVRLALAEGVVLAPVRVTANRRCPALRADEASAAHARWDEVRKALVTARAAVAAGAVEFALERTVTEFEGHSRRPVREERTVVSDDEELFAAPPATLLRDSGFVRTVHDPGGEPATQYSLPDAAVLVSEPFTESHCFRPVGGGRGRRGQFGLAFEPMRRRGSARRPDVRGTLWLDSASYELRELEVRFTDLPVAWGLGPPGGRITFARRADGLWYVDRWTLVMPRLAPAIGPLGEPAALALVGTREEGGRTLVGAALPRAHPDSAVVEGVVVDSARGLIGAPGVEVAVAGHAFRVRTGAAGAFRLAVPFAELAAGPDARSARVMLATADPTLAALGMPAPPVSARLVRGRTVTVRLGLPSAGTVRRPVCPAARANEVVAVGVVRALVPPPRGGTADSANAPVAPGAVVYVTAPGAGTLARTRTGPDGVYVACGLPADRELRFTVRPAAEARQVWFAGTTRGGLIVQDLWPSPREVGGGP